MDFRLSDQQQTLYDDLVGFAQRELNNRVGDRDRAQEFDRVSWAKCGERRLQGLPVPEEHGGLGLDPLTTSLALQALGYGCRDGGFVFTLSAHMLACVVPIWKHGTEDQRKRILPRLADGSLIAVNGMTEPSSGSDVFLMSTRATPVDGGFLVNGVKTFSTAGPIADIALVYALTDAEGGFHKGITAFLIERDTPGFASGETIEKMGLRTAPMGELVLKDVFVPFENVVGEIGTGGQIFAQSMEWERASLMAVHVGAMEWLLESAVAYARERKSGGLPIGRHQAVAHRLADLKVRLEASRLLTYKACFDIDRDRRAGLAASIAKLFASEAFVASAMDALRTLGGYGYLSDRAIERTLRDAVGSTIYSGTNDVQRSIIARWLGLPTN